MKLENQVNSLEQGKRLKELGINACPTFTWWDYPNVSWASSIEPLLKYGTDPAGFSTIKGQNEELANAGYPAFTVAELLRMNNETITINKLQLINPAEELAEHVIHSLKMGYLTAEECNKRLAA